MLYESNKCIVTVLHRGIVLCFIVSLCTRTYFLLHEMFADCHGDTRKILSSKVGANTADAKTHRANTIYMVPQ